MFKTCDSVIPSDRRNYGFGEYYVPVCGLGYVAELSDKVNHDDCLLCKVEVTVKNKTKKLCYKKINRQITEKNYKEFHGIPIKEKLIFPDKQPTKKRRVVEELFVYCDAIKPSTERKFGEGQYYVPTVGKKYTAQTVTNHDQCGLCNVENSTLCYVYTQENIDEDYKELFGIPNGKVMTFKLPKDKKTVVGSIKCPYHDDVHNSAIRNANGSIYCFAEQKLFPEPYL